MKVLIIGDSPALEIPQLDKYDLIIGLDGVVNHYKKIPVKFDVVIGDLDSIKHNIIEKLNTLDIKVIRIEDQDLSDTDKGIQYAISKNATEIHLVNVLHARLDHTLYNLGLLKKYHDKKCRIKIINNNEICEYLTDQSIQLIGNTDDAVAIMAYPEGIVNSQGLKYELNNYELSIGETESSSNCMLTSITYLHIKKSVLIIYNDCITCNYI